MRKYYSSVGDTAPVFPHFYVSDPLVEQGIIEIKDRANQTGEKIQIRYNDYESALQSEPIEYRLKENEIPTNSILKIVENIEIISDDPKINSKIEDCEDIQLCYAKEYLKIYTEYCDNYHIDSCDFTDKQLSLDDGK